MRSQSSSSRSNATDKSSTPSQSAPANCVQHVRARLCGMQAGRLAVGGCRVRSTPPSGWAWTGGEAEAQAGRWAASQHPPAGQRPSSSHSRLRWGCPRGGKGAQTGSCRKGAGEAPQPAPKHRGGWGALGDRGGQRGQCRESGGTGSSLEGRVPRVPQPRFLGLGLIIPDTPLGLAGSPLSLGEEVRGGVCQLCRKLCRAP